MIFTSPFAIFCYVLLAFNIVTTIIIRSKKEKMIADNLRLSPDKRAKRIEAYRKLLKTQKIPVVIMPILIPLMIGCHFIVPDDKNMFLFLSGFFAIATIFLIEDIQFRKSIIKRLEAMQNEAAPQITTPEESPAIVAARVRKVKIILLLFMTVFLVGPIIALYFTLDMPWWLFLVLSAAMLIAIAIGFSLGQKRAKKNLNSKKSNTETP